MAGRLCQGFTSYALARAFQLDPSFALEARYNIAPGTRVPVVRRLPRRERELARLLWGFIPPWGSDPVDGSRLFNARAETIAEKRLFRDAFHARRCLVPIDAFFIWGRAKRQPCAVRMRDERPFALAGVWTRWESADLRIESFAILTTGANDIVRRDTDRMPVIVPLEDYGEWLDPEVPGRLLGHLLAPFPPEKMLLYPVQRAVNDPDNDFPEILEPTDEQPRSAVSRLRRALV